MTQRLSDGEIKALLQSAKRIAVIGLSPVPTRPSHGVTRYLISQGYEIYGVRPASPPEILGRPCVESLQDLREPVDIIDVFRNSDALPGVVQEIQQWIHTLPESDRPKTLWLQEGVSNPEAENRARQMGLQVVADRCILKEHARLVH